MIISQIPYFNLSFVVNRHKNASGISDIGCVKRVSGKESGGNRCPRELDIEHRIHLLVELALDNGVVHGVCDDLLLLLGQHI